MTRLKLSDWAHVAEIIGAGVVIVRLVYIGHQVSDGTSAIGSAAANDTSLTDSAWWLRSNGHLRPPCQ